MFYDSAPDSLIWSIMIASPSPTPLVDELTVKYCTPTTNTNRTTTPLHVQADLTRILLLNKYGGIWVDTDDVLLRDLRPLIEFAGEFATKLTMSFYFNNNILGIRAQSDLSKSLVDIVCRLPYTGTDTRAYCKEVAEYCFPKWYWNHGVFQIAQREERAFVALPMFVVSPRFLVPVFSWNFLTINEWPCSLMWTIVSVTHPFTQHTPYSVMLVAIFSFAPQSSAVRQRNVACTLQTCTYTSMLSAHTVCLLLSIFGPCPNTTPCRFGLVAPVLLHPHSRVALSKVDDISRIWMLSANAALGKRWGTHPELEDG
jgi:hypothetical protein